MRLQGAVFDGTEALLGTAGVPLPGVKEFLSLMKIEDVWMYLICDGAAAPVRTALEQSGLWNYFRGLLSAEEQGRAPLDPELYERRCGVCAPPGGHRALHCPGAGRCGRPRRPGSRWCWLGRATGGGVRPGGCDGVRLPGYDPRGALSAREKWCFDRKALSSGNICAIMMSAIHSSGAPERARERNRYERKRSRGAPPAASGRTGAASPMCGAAM